MKNNSDKKRKSFFCYRFNFTEQIKLLEDVSQVVLILENIDRYCNGEELAKGDKLTDMIFSMWRAFVDDDEERNEEKKRRLSERGKKGADGLWAKRKAQTRNPDIPFVEAEEVERYPFEEFWELYDKKINRNACQRLWTQLSDEDKAQIMAHVPQYVASKSEKRYRRDPYNYLSKRGWEDEIITPQSNGNYNIQPNNREAQRQRNMFNAMQCVLDAAANVKPFDAPTE